MTPQVTGTDARATFGWSADIHIAPGSVPDRPAGRGAAYRPDKLRLTFQAIATGSTLRPLCLASARVTGDARRSVQVTGVALSGARLRQNGSAGGSRYDEPFYGRADLAPDWAQPLIAAALADLVTAI